MYNAYFKNCETFCYQNRRKLSGCNKNVTNQQFIFLGYLLDMKASFRINIKISKDINFVLLQKDKACKIIFRSGIN